MIRLNLDGACDRTVADPLSGLLIPTTSKSAVAAPFFAWREQYPDAIFHWVVFSAIGVRRAGGAKGGELFAGPTRLQRPAAEELFRDGFMPFVAPR